ncbi:MAG: HAMP domain-containing sensor histidine kinase [Gammaproteobacteria bacterium]|nr:HAMP domain-containing sensor histidine kinase [Gammaproteobacteria bacterium]
MSVVTLLLLLTLLLFVGKSWQSMERLGPVLNHTLEIAKLQEIQHQHFVILKDIDTDAQQVTAAQEILQREIIGAIALGSYLVPQSGERLQSAHRSLDNLGDAPRQALEESLETIRQVVSEEISAHDSLLAELQANSRWEFIITLILVFLVPLLSALAVYRLQKQLWLPLQNLGMLMGLLAKPGYENAPTQDVDPILLPLFERYNEMVNRLAHLERVSRTRQQDLELAINNANSIVLEQQWALSNTERLAAVGEVVANVAHELRNPLAGVQMALENLGRELGDSDQSERLRLVLGEIDRLKRLLNELLGQSAQTPAPLISLNLAEAVRSVLTLLRFQLHAGVRIREEIPEVINCQLPEARFKQVVLNLLLNATQSLGAGEGTIFVGAVKENGYVRLSVCDDGPGFPDELLRTGVRPFATWRESGTGLGLSMARRFTRDLGGEIELCNLQPRGARVTIFLPDGGTRV